MTSCAHYVQSGKTALGNPRMSDRELGERLPSRFIQQNIARAKAGYMTDTIAVELGELLKKHGVIEHVAEVIIVARAERERDDVVRKTLLDFAKKVVGRVSVTAVSALGALTVALGLLTPVEPASAHAGGEGRFRRRP